MVLNLGNVGKVKTSHHPLQVPIITVHVYPSLTDAAKVLPMKFENENEDKNFVMTI